MGVAVFGPNVSDRLSSTTIVQLSVSMIDSKYICCRISAHRRCVGRIAGMNLEAMLQLRD